MASTALKAKYARNVQKMNLLSKLTASSLTDLYVPTTNAKPELADQLSDGYFRKPGANQGYAFSAEVYYK